MQLFKQSRNFGVNIILTGLSDAGKTTLLYSSLFGGLETVPKLQKTESFNFEILNYMGKSLLIWDTSGDESFIKNLLPIMFSTIKIRAVVYVVSLLQGDKLVFDEINNELRSLLYSQQLSSCRFCVLFNTFGFTSDSWPKQPAEFASLLGLCYLPPQIDNRTKWFVVDTSKGFKDNGWRMAVEFILFNSIPNMPYYTNVPDFELTPIHSYYSQYDGKTPYGYNFRQIIPSTVGYHIPAQKTTANKNDQNNESQKKDKFSFFSKIFNRKKRVP
ncbi:ADP-ribosylation factor [Cryptosporidium ryanae]|uniref:ADP-ribosylation factor n=1 Tax=Cryptosporidium ryanae TaxID=515981 RepID=UPI00351A0051|nr:ADP-ribosylation factor [Cryptosporidium ryanae]